VKGKIASKHLATRFPEPSCPGCDPLAGFEVITYGRFWGVHRGQTSLPYSRRMPRVGLPSPGFMRAHVVG
jgi:hypothetical protein